VKCGALDSTDATRRGMLEVLPQAQAAGGKAQLDAQLGQGSFFDTEHSSAEPQPELPVPALPDDRESKGAMEKETLGLFLSSHPLKEVRPALRARVDCSLAELRAKKDGEWVTVGGVIAECKRIRTKKGDPMMFATLDDLEGQVEMLVFNSSYAENEGKVAVDEVVLVRGRVDHKEQGDTKLIAQEVERFEASAEEVASAAQAADREPLVRRLTLHVAGDVSPSFLDDLKTVVQHHPGDHELMLLVGQRSLLLGESYRVAATAGCRAELGGLDGATLGACPAPQRRESSTSAASAAPSAIASSTHPAA